MPSNSRRNGSSGVAFSGCTPWDPSGSVGRSWRQSRANLTIPCRVVLSLDIDLSFSKQGVDDLDRLFEAANAMIEGIAKRLVLRLVIASADPKDQPSDADAIDRIRSLGQSRRIAEARAHHDGADFNARRDRRQCRQE